MENKKKYVYYMQPSMSDEMESMLGDQERGRERREKYVRDAIQACGGAVKIDCRPCNGR